MTSGAMYSLTVHGSDEIAGPTPLTLNTEWVLTNGLGGFATGTVSGCATRRYHGLLIAAARPPVERISTLAAVAETVRIDGHEHRLDCHEFHSPDHHPSVFHPRGFQYLYRFEKDPSVVRWRYRVGPVAVTKELRLVWRRSAAVITYTVEPLDGTAPARIDLEFAPFLAMRDFHRHRRREQGEPFRVHAEEAGEAARVEVHADEPVTLHMEAEGCRFVERRDWWHNFRRRRESERGQDDSEDLFTPGAFERTLGEVYGPRRVRLYVSTEPIDRAALDRDDGRGDHLRRLVTNVQGAGFKGQGPGLERLVAASDDFIVTRYVGGREFRSVIAGYPWFSDWGRDTMISLPGLMLCTGRLEEAGQTLVTYANHIRDGLVPNRFDDYGGEPHYNTADASLWFVHAALEFRRLDGDEAVWGDVLRGACRQIIDAYHRGTDGPIAMDDDGLIAAGDEHTQLTWMDAKRDGVVFTPRHGKCVEINALWHRALTGCAAAMRDDDVVLAEKYHALARRVENSFAPTFWIGDLGYLLDHVNPQGSDRSLRPNQVLAVSLPASSALLSPAARARVMEVVRSRLLTPMGLRTLPRDDPNYHGRHAGSMFERDRAYHQGTVWAWLIGPYVEGWLNAHNFDADARRHAAEAIEPLLAELPRHSVGQLHEIFDGDEPHHPSGCIAQAWSVAELLRAAVLVGSPAVSLDSPPRLTTMP